MTAAERPTRAQVEAIKQKWQENSHTRSAQDAYWLALAYLALLDEHNAQLAALQEKLEHVEIQSESHLRGVVNASNALERREADYMAAQVTIRELTARLEECRKRPKESI